MSTWMAPRGDAFYALGNRVTCEIQGFVVTFAIVNFVAYFFVFVAVREFVYSNNGVETRSGVLEHY